jgi:hypothetical protein
MILPVLRRSQKALRLPQDDRALAPDWPEKMHEAASAGRVMLLVYRG